jgi:outer membrane protein TolC
MRAAVLLALLIPAAAQAEETLTLERAIDLARRRHPTVEAQRAQATVARARTQQADAALWPFLTGSVAYQPQTPNFAPSPAQRQAIARGVGTVLDASGMPVMVSCTPEGQANCMPVAVANPVWSLREYWTLAVGLTWVPWDWGQSVYASLSARSLARAAELGVTSAERDVVLEVKLAFFAVVTATRQIEVGEESVKAFRLQLDQTQAFYQSGLRTKIDVATAESALAGAALTLTRARAALETARARLALALGEDAWRDWRPVLDPGVLDVQPRDEAWLRTPGPALVDSALRARLEPRQLELQAQSYGELARSRRGQYLPRLSVTAGPEWAGTSLSALVPNVSVGVALGYPVGGMSPLLTAGQVREAEGNRLASLAQERATREGIRQETIDARALLASGREEVVAARALLASATAQRELAVGRYASGVGDIIELVNAMLNFVSARFQLAQAGYDLASGRARLEHALGLDR